MKPIWLIEADVEGLPSEALKAEIQRQGMSVQTVKPFLHSKFPRDILNAENLPIDALVIFTGTLDLMRYIQNHRRWRPGGWCNFDNLACTQYYSFFGQYLLNSNYTILPIAEAIRQKESLFSLFGQNGEIFVRPDGVDKSFSGGLVSDEEFESFLVSKSADPTMLVVMASPIQISKEWRLFVAHGSVATGSQYRINHETEIAPELPAHVVDYANEVLKNTIWRPDPLFVMDIGELDGELGIVELNSFSCSGQCECDLEQYVATATAAASQLA